MIMSVLNHVHRRPVGQAAGRQVDWIVVSLVRHSVGLMVDRTDVTDLGRPDVRKGSCIKWRMDRLPLFFICS